MINLDSFALKNISRGEPAWLSAERNEAFAIFERLPMPSSKEELWRYVNIDFDIGDYLLPVEPGCVEVSPLEGAATLDVVDGLAIGSGTRNPDFTLIPLALDRTEDRNDSTRYSSPGSGHDKFSAAHRAFGTDGASIRVPEGRVVREPLVVRVQSTLPGSISFPRVMIDIGPSAQASVVIRLSSPDLLETVVVPEIDVMLGPAANLDLTVNQVWGDTTTSLGRTRIEADRDANITFAEVGLGGALSRLYLAVDLLGVGSSAKIVGAYFGDEKQVLDYRYFMRHARENTTSEMFLKGAVDDEALSIFTGMIRIEEEAQRTNAFQTNRNLLLSDQASAQSVPNLEILANDVKCGHGSTVGPLDAEQRYYLMSRGLDRDRADQLQLKGFFEDALSRFPVSTELDSVRERVHAKYERTQSADRV